MTTMNRKREVDVVLSSVKRIVNEELQATQSGSVVEKLLLTPAFRVDTPPPRPETGERVPSALELRIAELERAVSGQPGNWEPDGSELIDEETPHELVYAPAKTRPPASQEVSEPDAEPVEAEPVSAPEAKEPDLTERVLKAVETPETSRVRDGAEIDEEQLRDMVAEMVRAELQGVLGERITRNVRKLVRREIHRALLTRDLD